MSRNSKKSNSKKSRDGSSRPNSTFQKQESAFHKEESVLNYGSNLEWERSEMWKGVSEE